MKSFKAAVLTALLLGGAVTCYAQDTVGAQPQAADQQDQLSDIIVTAQRRSERLQDVPISVSTANAQMLRNASVANALDLSKVIPAVNILYATGTYTPFIRGIGNPIAVAGNEASVSTYIDGVYVARVHADFLPFQEVERVEVLKGPQGTLFGRNSTGGLINLITRTPGRDPVIEGTVEYGNYDRKAGSVYMSTPLGESAAIGFSAFGVDQGDTWGVNETTGNGVGREWKYGFRSKLVADLSDVTKITASLGYVKSWNNFPSNNNAARGTTQGNPPGFPPTIYLPLSFYNTRSNTDSDNNAKSIDAMLRVDQKLGSLDFVSISGYRRSKIRIYNDYDYTPINFFNADLRNREKQFSQEIQLLSDQNASFKWIVGAYFLHLDSGYHPAIFSGLQFPGVNRLLYGRQKTNSYSAFAQTTIEVVPALSLTLGGRYTSDDVSASGRTDITAPGGSPILTPGVTARASTNFSKFTYRAALDYKLTEDVLLYGSISRGFKSGVYVTLPITVTPARPEVVDAYELGFKAEFLDKRLRLNAAVFQSDISDPQVQRIFNATNQTINAKGARSRGFEAEMNALVTRSLEIRAAFTYLDAKYTDFTDAPFTSPVSELVNGIVPGCTTPATGNINPLNGGNVAYCAGDATGNRISRAPKLTASFGLEYSQPIGDYTLRFSPNLAYNDGFFWDPDNRLQQPSYLLVDGTIALVAPNDRWTVRLWGKNLTDKRYYNYVSEQGQAAGHAGNPGSPRTYGVAVDFKF